MSDGIERLLWACRIGDLEQTLSALATEWGEALQLSSCRIELVQRPFVCGREAAVSVRWGRNLNVLVTRGISAAGDNDPPTPSKNAVVLYHNRIPVARASGSPAHLVLASSEEWRGASAWLIAQAIQFQEELNRQKLDAMAEYAAGAAHEINNPLGTIIGRTQQLLAGETDPERRRWLETVGASAYRVRDMIGDTMLFGRPPEPRLKPVDLHEQVLMVTGRFAEEFHRRRISLFCTGTFSAAGAAGIQRTVHADPVQVSVVISELVRNALEAVPDNSGTITIELQNEIVGGRAWAVMKVSDNGPGPSPEAREHLFDPFYSGRQAGRGLGFGLSKCWRIIQLHGGTIRAAAPVEGGLEVVVHWPILDADG